MDVKTTNLIFEAQSNIDRLQKMIGLLTNIRDKAIDNGEVEESELEEFMQKMSLLNTTNPINKEQLN